MEIMDGNSTYWPISIVATILVWFGYVPEFYRLYRERTASNAGIYMWLLWTSSSTLSTLYACLSGASVLIIVNIGTILFLTVASALGNACIACGRAAPVIPLRFPVGDPSMTCSFP